MAIKRRKARRTRSEPRQPITRDEFESVRTTLADCCRQLEVQFKRMATMHAEIDHLSAKQSNGRRSSPRTD